MKKTGQLRAGAVRFAGGLFACGLAALLAQGGCAESEPIEFVLLPDGGSSVTATGGSDSPSTGGQQGTGGTVGTGGDQGTGGNSSTGGSKGTGGFTATGGITGTGGNGTGGVKATGGNNGTGGTGGMGGVRATGGAGGMKATGGSNGTGGTVGTGGAGGSGATFTQVYQMIFSVSCTGSQCHNPGSQGGFSFSSQSTAYTAVKSRVTAGNANNSSIYTLVNGGRMPPTGKLSSSMISLLASWINAGALNN
jgi:hypothetical protein